MALDAAGNFYISDRGHSHQVKVFSPAGKLLRAIGKAGEPATGDYDPLHMNNPNGLGIDSQGRVWVAEDDYHPKRVSLWTAEGELLRGFLRPGRIWRRRRARFAGQKPLLLQGTGIPSRLAAGDRPAGAGLLSARANCSKPTAAPILPTRLFIRRHARASDISRAATPTCRPAAITASFIWHDDGPQARLVAALGNAHGWRVLKSEPFRALWPEGVNPLGDEHQNPAAFSWSDRDGDGLPQPAEVKIVKAVCGGVTTMHDLSFVCARFDGKTVEFTPTGYNEHGAPQYMTSMRRACWPREPRGRLRRAATRR